MNNELENETNIPKEMENSATPQEQDTQADILENPTPEPEEPLQSIGDIFSKRREELGISLPQVVETTKIRKKYLEALEDDNFKAIPNLLAARGFIKIYGNFLNLNVKELVEIFNKRFPEDASTVNVPSNEMSIKDDKYRRGLLSKSLKSTNASSYNYSRRIKRKKNTYIASVTFGVILVVGAIILLSNHYLKRTVGDLKKEQRTKSEVAVPTAMITPEELKNRQAQSEVVFVTAKATNSTWARVVVDGRVTFSGNLDRGNSKTWTGEQYISIKASRPDRLELIVNGEFAGTMGTESTMKEKTFYLPKMTKKATAETKIKEVNKKAVDKKDIKKTTEETEKVTTKNVES